MPEIVGIRFKPAGKIYFYDPAGVPFEAGDYAIVEGTQGREIGRVAIAPKQVLDADLAEPLKRVLQRAEQRDLETWESFRAREQEVLAECRAQVKELGLPMKLLSVEQNFEGTRLMIFFGAEERVDFRELVRRLAARFRTRIELRQVGPRDEAKLVGDLGRCGRPLCCTSFLSEFGPVSIKMAKDQGLPLNPTKISGVCGRLLCCLAYEEDFYVTTRTKLPRVGSSVRTAKGAGVVVGSNIIRESVGVQLESGEIMEVPLGQLQIAEGPSRQPAAVAESETASGASLTTFQN